MENIIKEINKIQSEENLKEILNSNTKNQLEIIKQTFWYKKSYKFSYLDYWFWGMFIILFIWLYIAN
mgnify:CR=1 FL=1